jgi:hypothetical protein
MWELDVMEEFDDDGFDDDLCYHPRNQVLGAAEANPGLLQDRRV